MTWECGALLLDMDGVLVDSAERIRRTWTEWALGHGLDAQAVVRAAQGRRTIETVRAVAPHLDAEAELAILGHGAHETDGVREVAGARALARALPAGRWAVVTSATRAVAELRLRHVGLPVPAVLVAAEEVEHGKPHPEGFLKAAAHLGMAPAQCVVVEDAPAGVAAAHAGGMRVVALTSSHSSGELAAADAIIDSLAQLELSADATGLRLHLRRWGVA